MEKSNQPLHGEPVTLVMHNRWGESPEDLFLDSKEWEAEQEWRKQKEAEFHKNMVKFLTGLHRKQT